MTRDDILACAEQLKAQKRLTADDDPDLWHVALDVLLRDAEYDISQGKQRVVWIRLGACSHWLRPHQARWTADGGFAYPAGYDDGIYGCEGLPQFDWSVYLNKEQSGRWQIFPEVLGRKSSRTLDLRVTFPTRTARHRQAVIHTIWNPGTPANPRQKRTRFYGLRRGEAGWQLKATVDYPPEK